MPINFLATPMIKQDGGTYIEVEWLRGQLVRELYCLGYGLTFGQVLELVDTLREIVQ